jgi:hypothetical protein
MITAAGIGSQRLPSQQQPTETADHAGPAQQARFERATHLMIAGWVQGRPDVAVRAPSR